MKKTNKDKVYKSYEKIAEWFDKIRGRDLEYEKAYLERMILEVKPKGKILDLGCGMGEPIAKYFVDHGFQVTGFDGSRKLIKKARGYIPEVQFYVQDMREIDLKEKFDGIILWHSLFHLSQQDQRSMFKIIEKHINPGGILLFTSGDAEGEIWGDNGGENLYHASLSIEEYKRLLTQLHFDIILNKIKDKECGDTTVWMAKYNKLQKD